MKVGNYTRNFGGDCKQGVFWFMVTVEQLLRNAVL